MGTREFTPVVYTLFLTSNDRERVLQCKGAWYALGQWEYHADVINAILLSNKLARVYSTYAW